MRTIEEVVKEIKNIHELETELKGKITPSKIPMLLKEILEIGKSIESVNGDLISRSATIKALEEGAFVPDWNLALAQAIVSKQPTAYNDGWISCSERLPSERDWYLAVFKEGDSDFVLVPRVADYIGKETVCTTNEGWLIIDLEDEMGINAYYKNLVCIAWQPLPAPYQPKGEA